MSGGYTWIRAGVYFFVKLFQMNIFKTIKRSLYSIVIFVPYLGRQVLLFVPGIYLQDKLSAPLFRTTDGHTPHPGVLYRSSNNGSLFSWPSWDFEKAIGVNYFHCLYFFLTVGHKRTFTRSETLCPILMKLCTHNRIRNSYICSFLVVQKHNKN